MKWNKKIKAISERNSEKLKYDFMPPILEIIERPANIWGSIVILGLFSLLLTAFIWSFLAKVDVVITGMARVTPDSEMITVQSADTGKVKSIYVSSGDLIRKGDLLLELDPSATDIDLENIKANIERLTQEMNFYMDIYDERISDTQEIQSSASSIGEELILTEALVLHLDYKSLEYDIKTWSDEVDNTRLEVKGIENDISAAKQKIGLYEKIIAAGGAEQQRLNNLIKLKDQYEAQLSEISPKDPMYISLESTIQSVDQQISLQRPVALSEATANEMNLLDAENKLAALEINLEKSNTSIKQMLTKIEQGKTDLEGLEMRSKSAVLSAIEERKLAIEDLETNLEKAEYIEENQKIFAPVDGIVSDATVLTTDSVVTASQPLMMIIPDADQTIIQCTILNKDIGVLSVGQNCEVKLDAYPYSKYGTVKGEISYISPQSFQDDVMGFAYNINVIIDEDTLGDEITIKSGMTGTAEVKVGKRRVIDFFLEPITNALDSSIKEK